MSRSGYNHSWDFDTWHLIRYRGAVASAMRGKRGQQFLHDLLNAMAALPEPKLVANELETEEGAVCAIGALGRARGVDMKKLDPEDIETVAGVFNIADCLAREVVYMNDEGSYDETPEQRFSRMRAWVEHELFDSRTPQESST